MLLFINLRLPLRDTGGKDYLRRIAYSQRYRYGFFLRRRRRSQQYAALRDGLLLEKNCVKALSNAKRTVKSHLHIIKRKENFYGKIDIFKPV